VTLHGRPMLAWSVEAFAASARVDSVVIAAPPGAEAEVEGAAAAGDPPVALSVVTGGASRSESVSLALAAAKVEIVAVHDAARPLVTPELIDALVDGLAARPDADGVIAAAPLTDTVKRAREPRPAEGEVPRGGPTIAKTESRDHLWAAQTPQVFRAAMMREALDADPQRVAAATDDAMLVERAGGKVLIHPAPAENLKVTTPFELRLAEFLLAARSR
jgi:2-C-methyl-D-erythritol 4-phosphate cytidylyltransferase